MLRPIISEEETILRASQGKGNSHQHLGNGRSTDEGKSRGNQSKEFKPFAEAKGSTITKTDLSKSLVRIRQFKQSGRGVVGDEKYCNKLREAKPKKGEFPTMVGSRARVEARGIAAGARYSSLQNGHSKGRRGRTTFTQNDGH